jgi:hypothetical protein
MVKMRHVSSLTIIKGFDNFKSLFQMCSYIKTGLRNFIVLDTLSRKPIIADILRNISQEHSAKQKPKHVGSILFVSHNWLGLDAWFFYTIATKWKILLFNKFSNRAMREKQSK